jgi:antitoxin HicB
VALPLMTSLKASLCRALRESGITRAELMRHLGWNRESVDRLFRLDHASRLGQIEAAFKALRAREEMADQTTPNDYPK